MVNLRWRKRHEQDHYAHLNQRDDPRVQCCLHWRVVNTSHTARNRKLGDLMKSNARNAYKAYVILKNAGLHLMKNKWAEGAHFEISREDCTHLNAWLDGGGKGKLYWADYWDEVIESSGTSALNELLDKNGLCFEWVNPAVIAVYDV